MIQSPTFRRFARNTFALAALVSAVMLTLQFGSMATSLSGDEQAAFAASAGTSPEGDVELTPASGQLSTTIALSPEPAPAFCPGDSVAGYRWQTFISEASNDPATFTYDAQGPVVPGGGVGITFPLVSSSGVNQVNRNTAADTGNGGQITPIPGFDLSIYGALLVDGDYKIGFACTLAGETVSFWTTGIQISAGSFEASTTSTTSTSSTSSTTSTTTTTTTVAGGSTTTTVAGGTTTTTVAGDDDHDAWQAGHRAQPCTPSTPTPVGRTGHVPELSGRRDDHVHAVGVDAELGHRCVRGRRRALTSGRSPAPDAGTGDDRHGDRQLHGRADRARAATRSR